MLSRSELEAIGHYLSERYPPRVFAPVAALLTGAAWLASRGPWSAAHAAASFLALGAAVLHFRLLDDLADVKIDRAAKPERVLCQAPSLRPFWRFYFALGMALVATAAWGGPAAAMSLAALMALWNAWYFALRPRVPSRRARRALPLLKYPALALWAAMASGSGLAPAAWAVAPAVLFAFVAYEEMHDPLAPLPANGGDRSKPFCERE